LCNGVLWTPILDANGNFGGELIRRIAEKQKVWGFNHGDLLALLRAIYANIYTVLPIVGRVLIYM
jgi:hypothetical protein